MNVYENLLAKKSKLAVIGLGYVGLPLALEFAGSFSVVAFDIDADKIELLKRGIDPNREVSAERFRDKDIVFTDDAISLALASFFVIAVPTPVDQFNVPDLGPLTTAAALVGGQLKRGDFVVFESTTYPGCTEEDCLPLLEKQSGLQLGRDFKLGYSPERINPGDAKNTLRTVMKVVSGSDAEALEEIALVYSQIVDAGVFRARSIKVAEASKMMENTQRTVNIALMNELSLIFDRMKINTYDVLEAAVTKWNFQAFQPGLVGGHCIGVDSNYLTYKAETLGVQSRVIASSRIVNDNMAKYLARKIIRYVLRVSEYPRVLIMGVTFKENVNDIRNSKIIDTVAELRAFHVAVDIVDPFADPNEVSKLYELQLSNAPSGKYEAVVITVPHSPYRMLNDDYFNEITPENGVVVDLKGIYRNQIHSRPYWSL